MNLLLSSILLLSAVYCANGYSCFTCTDELPNVDATAVKQCTKAGNGIDPNSNNDAIATGENCYQAKITVGTVGYTIRGKLTPASLACDLAVVREVAKKAFKDAAATTADDQIQVVKCEVCGTEKCNKDLPFPKLPDSCYKCSDEEPTKSDATAMKKCIIKSQQFQADSETVEKDKDKECYVAQIEVGKKNFTIRGQLTPATGNCDDSAVKTHAATAFEAAATPTDVTIHHCKTCKPDKCNRDYPYPTKSTKVDSEANHSANSFIHLQMLYFMFFLNMFYFFL